MITIRGFLDYLEKDAGSGDAVRVHEDCVRILSATDKMEQLINELLKLSRIGRIVNPPELVPMEVIVEDAVELLTSSIKTRGVTITIADDLPDVCVDRTRFLEVMVNLIENAIKFTGDQLQPHIEIGVRTGVKDPVFFVKDNGIGIAEEDQVRIFSRFGKIDSSTAGMGMGLAIVKRIVEFHGGTIWVESDGAGKGITFCFTIPGPESPMK